MNARVPSSVLVKAPHLPRHVTSYHVPKGTRIEGMGHLPLLPTWRQCCHLGSLEGPGHLPVLVVDGL